MAKTNVAYSIGDVPVANEAEMSEKDKEFLDAAFTYHAPTGDQVTDLQAVTIAGRTFAATILAHVPPSGRPQYGSSASSGSSDVGEFGDRELREALGTQPGENRKNTARKSAP